MALASLLRLVRCPLCDQEWGLLSDLDRLAHLVVCSTAVAVESMTVVELDNPKGEDTK